MISWSKQYFKGLTEAEHQANDDWFIQSLALLKPSGVLIVPCLGKRFNKQGECIDGERDVYRHSGVRTRDGDHP